MSQRLNRLQTQARVKNAFFRYKSIIGESLHARSRTGQEAESAREMDCAVLELVTQAFHYAVGSPEAN